MRLHATRYAVFTLLLGFGLLLTACQSNPFFWDKQASDKVNAAMADARRDAAAKPTVPPEVSEALLPSLGGAASPAADTTLEPRFDLTVNNAPVRQVLMGLVEGTPYSMVVHPDVSGNVTLHLKSATVPQAMEALRTVYGYEYRRDGNRYMVLGRGMQARIYPVNYLNLERKGQSLTRVSTGELTRSGATGTSGGGTSGGGTPPGTSSTSTLASVQVETDSKATFWKDLQDSLVTIIGTANGRKVVVNPQAGVVVVRAMPDELRMVEDYLGVTHDSINRQVILEAKVLEVELNDGYQTGINWSALGASSTFGMVGGGTIFGRGTSEIAGNTGILNPSAYTGVSGTNTSAFGGVFSAAIKTTDFAAFLELLQTQGNVHVLSTPRVSTINNQKAVIKVGGDEFFVTSATGGTAATATTPATAPTVILTPFFSGISLDVMPQIDEANNIILHIHPAVSDVIQKDKKFIVGDQQFNLPLASSTIQESDNVVRATDGQVVVIGGLMKEGATDDNASIPFLGDIPLLGNAFKHKRVTRIKRELVLLLKPTIVSAPRVWETAVEEAQGRIQKLKR